MLLTKKVLRDSLCVDINANLVRIFSVIVTKYNTGTPEKIIPCATQEFLEKGFEKATIRSIAARANMSASGLYRHFESKDALFNAIVEEPARIFMDTFRQSYRSFLDLPVSVQIESFSSVENPRCSEDTDWFITYMYDHYDVFKLVFCHSAGTAYEGYLDRLIQTAIGDADKLILGLRNSGYPLEDVDDKLVHEVLSGYWVNVVGFLHHDMHRDEARRYVKKVQEYHAAGWIKLLAL